MTRSRIRLAAAVVVVAWVLGLTSAANAEELVAVSAGSSSATLPAEKTATVVIPFTPADGVTGLTAAIEAVRRDTKPTSVTEQNAVSIELASDTIVVTIDVDSWPRVGTYLVSVRLRAEGKGAQLVELTFIRPAASIQTRATAKVERTVGFPELWWPLLGVHERKPTFTLRGGDETRVLSLSAGASASDAAAGDKDEDVTVVFPDYDDAQPTELKTPLVAFGQIDLPYEIKGDLPLGTVTRTVEINSPQFAAPISVAVEITTRRHEVIIPILVVLGLVAGLLIRRALVRVHEWVSSERLQRGLVRKLERLESEHTDPAVLTALRANLSKVRSARGWKRAEYKAKIDAIWEEVNAALDALEATLLTTAASISTFESSLRRSTRLPNELAMAVTQARDALRSTRDQVHARNGAGATAGMDSVRRVVVSEVAPAANRIIEELSGKLTALASFAGTWPAVLGEVESVAVRAKEVLPATATPQPDAPTLAESIGTLLSGIGESLRLLDLLPEAVDQAIRTLKKDGSVSHDPTVASAIAEARLAAREGDPVPRVIGTTEALVALKNAVDAVVGGRQDESARLAATPEGGGSSASGTTILEAAEAPPDELVPTSVPWVPRMAGDVTFMALTSLEFFLEAIRFLVLAALLVLVSYRWFEDGWVGDMDDMVKVFFWAFGLDLSLELVTQTFKARPEVLA